ncbi:MAG TPA: ABC transporter permease [Terriglobales bacterium]|nr:ABC transporter permease [Terriglobales bacterium]
MKVEEQANLTSARLTPPSSPQPAHRNGRWAGYRALLTARMKELKREPEVVFWVFVFPLLLALGLGIAFRDKPAGVTSIAVVSGAGAERAIHWLEASPQRAGIHADVLPEAEAFNRFRLGKYALVVIPQADGSVRYRYDPARPESVLARAQVDDALQAAAGRKDLVATSSETAMEPGSRYIDFLIPGLLGMNLMNSGMWGIGFALVDMRQRKLLKRYLATPMRRSDFLLALSSSRLVLMLIEVALLLGFGMLVFHMRVLGSLLTILLIGAVGAMTFGGLGLLTASRAQKLETVSGLINVVMLPMWVFSGVFFSYERFPALLLPFIKALPLTALNDALRATILEGAPLAAQGARLAIMAIWGGVSFLLAVKWFRWV